MNPVPKPPKLPMVYRREPAGRRMVSNPRGQWISHAQHVHAVLLLETYIERLQKRLRVASLDVDRMDHLERMVAQVREDGDPPTLRVAVDIEKARAR